MAINANDYYNVSENVIHVPTHIGCISLFYLHKNKLMISAVRVRIAKKYIKNIKVSIGFFFLVIVKPALINPVNILIDIIIN